MADIGVAGRDTYFSRVARALDRWRVAAVALVTLLLSAEALSSSDLLDFFSPVEIVLAWSEHFLELAVLAAALTIVYTVVDEALRSRQRRMRLALTCATMIVLSPVLTLLLYGYYAHGFEHFRMLRAEIRRP